MAKKRIDWLLVLPTDFLGGAEQLLFHCANHLSNTGATVKVLILTKRKTGAWHKLEEKCDITYLPVKQLIVGYVLAFFRLVVWNLKMDIKRTLSSQTLINGFLGILKRIGLFRRTRIIVRESNSIFDLMDGKKLAIYSKAYSLGYRQVSLVICQTEKMKAHLLDHLPWLTNKVEVAVIPNPINLDLIKVMEKDKLEDLEKKEFLVAAGRLVPVKGFDILIQVFAKLRRQRPSLELVILGEGKERTQLQQLIFELGLTDSIHLPGYVTNVFPYFRNARLCIISSRLEGFPNVLLQMMSQNTEVVSTLSAGGIDKVPHLTTCQPNSVDALLHAIEERLDRPEDANDRRVFDAYLKKRTFSGFFDRIESHL